ncbi:KR domain-containing protein, partial [Streptomyces sp. NRRL F-5555]|uniref:KR domain-containing protein n=1 Tax=Streptomyces sp. NRRL F-5555 TaxID=1463863 RepID=UPI001F2DCAC5
MQNEHPGRVVLVDGEPGAELSVLVSGAVVSGEGQVAVRDGVWWVPRLVRAGVEAGSGVVAGSEAGAGSGSGADAGSDAGSGSGSVFGSGVVLVSGGTGGLGAVVARHLVVGHGVRDVLLVSRRGVGGSGVAGVVG